MNITLPHTIENITGEKLTFLGIVVKDGVEYLETESEVQPNAGPPMHVHYKQDEQHIPYKAYIRCYNCINIYFSSIETRPGTAFSFSG